MRSQQHKFREQGVDSTGYRGEIVTAAVSTGSPANGIDLVPDAAGAATLVRVLFKQVPSAAQGSFIYAAATPFVANTWVPIGSITSVNYTKGTETGEFRFPYVLEDSNGNRWDCSLDVTVT